MLALGAAGLTAGLASAAPAGGEAPIRLGVIGTGGRGTYLLGLALAGKVEVPALCDVKPANLARAVDLVAKARGGRKPAGYSAGPLDYRRLLDRDDLDAVVLGTPMQWHARMAIDALRAGKHVLSEVAAAMTLEECWGLVRAAEETGKLYMLSENCCYYDYTLMILEMVRRGLFGELTFAECGYVHNCTSLFFEADGRFTWRGEMIRDYGGNTYPTHALGPVAQWLSINRGDRLVRLVAGATGRSSLMKYVKGRFPEGHPARQIRYRASDSTNVLIETAKGACIDLRFDLFSPRPVVSTTYYSLQGTKASYESRSGSIWIEGRSHGDTWEPAANYAREFEHPLWSAQRRQAAGSGHGGIDYFVVDQFLAAVRRGGPSPIDCYDAAAWSAVIPLSAKSLAEGGKPQEIPDFTGGKWETARPLGV
jgi:predicted dehydrogenase